MQLSIKSHLFFLFQPHSQGRSPGQALIENICMKAVNQSIGTDNEVILIHINIKIQFY